MNDRRIIFVMVVVVLVATSWIFIASAPSIPADISEKNLLASGGGSSMQRVPVRRSHRKLKIDLSGVRNSGKQASPRMRMVDIKADN